MGNERERMTYLWPVGCKLNGAYFLSDSLNAPITWARGIEGYLREWGGLGPFSGN